jgi:hypothetical protein
MDKGDLKDIDVNASANALIAIVPETISDTFSHYELTEAIQHQFQVDISVTDISTYGPGFFLHIQTSAARNHILHRGFVSLRTYTIPIVPWNLKHVSTAVPLHDLLTSHPLNLHLAKDPDITEPYEHLTIDILGMPPHLCCDRVIHTLFRKICTINVIRFIPARIEYKISSQGRLTMIPKITHLGIRNLTTQNDMVNIWQLSYQTFTD